MSNEDKSNLGLIKSTSEPEKHIEPLFDYGDITERDKSVVSEVIEFLKTRDGVPSAMLIEELKIKFKIVEIPMMDLKTSIWYNLTKDERIGFSMQGHRETTDKDGNKIRIPHIGFSADLDYLDEMTQRLAKKIVALTNAGNKEKDK
tara:strand:+ start:250 stop:687 length:438 start_codon:yes stop_codon:yes gene_type:complete